MPEKVKVGVIGCGAISGAYFSHARSFPILEMHACADLNTDVARARGAEFGIPRICTVDELLADKDVEIVLNLTVPKAHVPIALRAIEAGKHTYAEKPLGIDREDGRKLIAAAKRKGVLVGCAPDTFMGAGIQTARKLIDDGAIGKPVAFTAYMQGRGHETWHPNPEFYYEPGGGPMFDMGPYYLTALLQMLGPVKRISGFASIAVPERTITHRDRDGNPGPKFGKKIKVETPDHIVGLIEFANGCTGSIIQSFATIEGNYDGRWPISISGTDAALRVPDPNGFDGTVMLRKLHERETTEMPHTFVKGYGRAVGLADMAYAIRSGRGIRASGEQAMAVLDLMQGFLDSSRTGKAYEPVVQYNRPAPMPANLPFGELDA
jgi:predicted dehydrogenase